MTTRHWRIGLLGVALLLLPAASGAFSFGSFAPGETIQSIQFASGGPGALTVAFDTTTNGLSVSADVVGITTDLASYTIAPDTVAFDSQVVLQSEMVFPPDPFILYGGLVTASFLNGSAMDLSIVDLDAPGSPNPLLEGEYSAGSPLQFQADPPGGLGTPVTGSLNGQFSVAGGDPAFLAAFGSAGTYSANLSSFVSNGVVVGSDLCVLIVGSPCSAGTELDSFTSEPSGLIQPVAVVPEPGLAALLLAAGGALAAARGRSTPLR